MPRTRPILPLLLPRWRSRPFVRPDHPLAPRLGSLWVPAADAGSSRLVNLASEEAGALRAMDLAAAEPEWATTQIGTGLRFDGGNGLVHASDVPWVPSDKEHTIAVVAVTATNPSNGVSTLYALNRGTDGAGSPWLGMYLEPGVNFLQAGTFDDFGTPMTIGVSWPSVGQPFAAIFTSRGDTDHELLLLNYGNGTVTWGQSSAGLGFMGGEPDRESIACDLAGDEAFNHYDGTVLGCFFWQRSFTAEEMLSWALDPFGMLADAERAPQVRVRALPDTTAAGQTLTANVLLFPGQAVLDNEAAGDLLEAEATLTPGDVSAGNTADGATATATATLIEGTPAATASSTVAGRQFVPVATLIPGNAGQAVGGDTLRAEAFLFPGGAFAEGAAGAVAFAVTATLIAGQGAGHSATPERTLAALAALMPGRAIGNFIPRPVHQIGGGGFGPGGDPERRAAIRRSVEAAAERIFDPEAVARRERIEAARRAREEAERTMPDRLRRLASFLLSLDDLG